jgi:hypothetical protein
LMYLPLCQIFSVLGMGMSAPERAKRLVIKFQNTAPHHERQCVARIAAARVANQIGGWP